jgi:serine-type D-Ala-D-Ala endopeptidase (penicillin-binding protein 7)
MTIAYNALPKSISKSLYTLRALRSAVSFCQKVALIASLFIVLPSVSSTSTATAASVSASVKKHSFAVKQSASRNKSAVRSKKFHQKASAKSAKNSKVRMSLRGGKGFKAMVGKKGKYKKVKYFVPAAPSMGMLSGLHRTPDPLDLKSSVALVIDAQTNQVLLEKNAQTSLPIASITKLMTALIVVDSHQDMNERLRIDEQDVQLEQRVRSRLKLGAEMSRREALQLALMSSENRAANMLTRYYPGGKPAFVDAMNRKAKQLGMSHSAFVEGTGLASSNMASAHDLVKLVKAAKNYPIIRELSTQSRYDLTDYSGHTVPFMSTNRLIGNPSWDITLQKTGFISAAGQCLVMAANLDGRPVIMVFLDSAGKLSRLGDAQRVRDWLTQQPTASANQVNQSFASPSATSTISAAKFATHSSGTLQWSSQ